MPTPLAEAATTTAIWLGVVEVATTKVAEFKPAGINTVVGTWTMPGALSEIDTTMPLDGAAPVKLTVAVIELPPMIEVGERVKAPTSAGVIVSFAVFEDVPSFAVTVAELLDATPVDEIRNCAEEAPGGTVTLTGTITSLFDDVSVTEAPTLGAIPVNVTVPIETSPPTTAVGDSVSDLTVAAVNVKPAVREVPPPDAVNFADCVFGTPAVAIENVAFDAPATTVTVGGDDT